MFCSSFGCFVVSCRVYCECPIVRSDIKFILQIVTHKKCGDRKLHSVLCQPEYLPETRECDDETQSDWNPFGWSILWMPKQCRSRDADENVQHVTDQIIWFALASLHAHTHTHTDQPDECALRLYWRCLRQHQIYWPFSVRRRRRRTLRLFSFAPHSVRLSAWVCNILVTFIDSVSFYSILLSDGSIL